MDLLQELTETELKVYNLLKDNKTSRQIGEQLNLKTHQVKEIQMVIYRKLKVSGKQDILRGRIGTFTHTGNTKKIGQNKDKMRYDFLRSLGYNGRNSNKYKSANKFLEEVKRYSKENNVTLDIQGCL